MDQVTQIAQGIATIIGVFGVIGAIRLIVSMVRFFDKLGENVEQNTIAIRILTEEISKLIHQQGRLGEFLERSVGGTKT